MCVNLDQGMQKNMKGKKFDTDKPQYDLIDAHALEDLAKVLTIGAQKYDRYNWVNVKPHRYEAALLRHIQAWRMGEREDPETGLHHMAHALANAMFLYLSLIHISEPTRPY